VSGAAWMHALDVEIALFEKFSSRWFSDGIKTLHVVSLFVTCICWFYCTVLAKIKLDLFLTRTI